jgi:hypothetical protein
MQKHILEEVPSGKDTSSKNSFFEFLGEAGRGLGTAMKTGMSAEECLSWVPFFKIGELNQDCQYSLSGFDFLFSRFSAIV